MKRLIFPITLIAIAAGIAGFIFIQKDNNIIPLPTVSEPDEKNPITLEMELNHTASGLGIIITPLEVIEDSRCPTDVQCIWAGTVKVRARILNDLHETIEVFELRKPVTRESAEITLTMVTPAPSSRQKAKSSDYKFTFRVEKFTKK